MDLCPDQIEFTAILLGYLHIHYFFATLCFIDCHFPSRSFILSFNKAPTKDPFLALSYRSENWGPKCGGGFCVASLSPWGQICSLLVPPPSYPAWFFPSVFLLSIFLQCRSSRIWMDFVKSNSQYWLDLRLPAFQRALYSRAFTGSVSDFNK